MNFFLKNGMEINVSIVFIKIKKNKHVIMLLGKSCQNAMETMGTSITNLSDGICQGKALVYTNIDKLIYLARQKWNHNGMFEKTFVLENNDLGKLENEATP